ncbi:hypothetical protein [Egbenema bharatensis]|uniref:hypothetical protein n=1 Tax=Egbenema bharatensis TaxID=3463334 RepID=UPI003A89E7D7
MPKFANMLSWQQAELIMQPAFIRIIDNIGKQLEQTNWKGTYTDIQVWAEGTPEETKALVVELQKQLVTATPQEAAEIQSRLDTLPSPYPGYQLCLERNEHRVTIDIWQLCYQICFRNYSPVLNALDKDLVVEIDTSLINQEGNDVDWQRLDQKARQAIEQIFSSLSDA